ncbi:19962_t:CDS:2 [Cetraspora pellucida]|uniref:19962_t:CDS:1 n=1 Tax=Cetraspora pellucida TaxID=1433469 RepID=A0A9N9H740_9GLOM|nr:19962_t:CDS:2 [Cetraspora pellucida]
MEILIPSKFTETDENYEFRTIELGDDSNENLSNIGIGTLYCPGDTLPALKEQLCKLEQRSGVEIKMNKETMHCFDNESFRFLATSKNDEISFTESWKRSIDESVRLFEYLFFRNPHKVQHTLTLNEARKIVLHLVKPLAGIEQRIQTNINLVKDRQKEIDSCAESIQDLKKRLCILQQVIEPRQLGYPRTTELLNNAKLLECIAIKSNELVKNKSANPSNYNNNAIIEGLEKTKREYLENIEVLKKMIAANDSSDDVITPEDIIRYEKELYNLQINRETLKNMKFMAERDQAFIFNQHRSNTNSHRNARKSVSKLFAQIYRC